jgi:hypothetical protein
MHKRPGNRGELKASRDLMNGLTRKFMTLRNGRHSR